LLNKKEFTKEERGEGRDEDYYNFWWSNGTESKARDEWLLSSVAICCCPKISWKQFIVIISIIEAITFIISLSIYGLSNSEAFAPDPRATEVMGWKDAKKIKNDGQVWRFFTPTFLHGSAYHINANIAA